jgi:hypothetical protein
MCLDIYNGGPNNNQPHLAQCDNLTGQRWILTKTDQGVESKMPGLRADPDVTKSVAGRRSRDTEGM